MNLKSRLSVVYSIFFSGLLLFILLVIYLVNDHNRETEFYKKLSELAVKSTLTPITDNTFQPFHISDGRFLHLNANGAFLQKLPTTVQVLIEPATLNKLRSVSEYRWYDQENRQYLGIFESKKQEIYIIGGYDKEGFEKTKQFGIILFFVWVIVVLITTLFSFFFVKKAFLPLARLNQQMSATTLHNLGQKIEMHTANIEINEIAENFNGMLDRLGKAFEFQKSFVYHASHELRTPLATMLSQTESALARNLTDQEYKELLVSLKEDQQELIELTNSLLIISQFEQMGQVKDWPILRIDEVLYEAMALTKKMFPTLSQEFIFGTMPESDEDFVVNGNASLLKSVFSNLIKNAYYYSTNQKVTITLESDGQTLLIHFDNEGMQLPADEKENIMTPFFRGGNALKTKGYGLGLAIVYRFITIHKGTITYTPISNDINRFTITLNKAGKNND